LVLEIDEDNLKHGVLGLVMAIVEVVRDALQIQAFKADGIRMLSEEEMNRLGEALMELDIAIEEIKKGAGDNRIC